MSRRFGLGFAVGVFVSLSWSCVLRKCVSRLLDTQCHLPVRADQAVQAQRWYARDPQCPDSLEFWLRNFVQHLRAKKEKHQKKEEGKDETARAPFGSTLDEYHRNYPKFVLKHLLAGTTYRVARRRAHACRLAHVGVRLPSHSRTRSHARASSCWLEVLKPIMVHFSSLKDICEDLVPPLGTTLSALSEADMSHDAAQGSEGWGANLDLLQRHLLFNSQLYRDYLQCRSRARLLETRKSKMCAEKRLEIIEQLRCS